jgi:hypothetical protein
VGGYGVRVGVKKIPTLEELKRFVQSQKKYCHLYVVTTDGIWIGNWIY